MQELEKILEEIEIRAIKDLEEENDRCSTTCKGCCSDVKERKCNCRDAIIVRAFKKLAKCMNDGWISVEERLPENNKLVLVWARSTARGADEWSLGSCDKGFWALGSYGGSLVFPSQLEAVAWRPLPEPYRSANKTEASDWREDMLRKFDRRD